MLNQVADLLQLWNQAASSEEFWASFVLLFLLSVLLVLGILL